LIKDQNQPGHKTKREIRKMLHPTIGEDFLPENDYLPGGFLTLNSLIKLQNGET